MNIQINQWYSNLIREKLYDSEGNHLHFRLEENSIFYVLDAKSYRVGEAGTLVHYLKILSKYGLVWLYMGQLLKEEYRKDFHKYYSKLR